MIRQLRPPARPPQGEVRIYAGRVKSAVLATLAVTFVVGAFLAVSAPPSGSSTNPPNGLLIFLGVVLFSAGAVVSFYYAVTPLPLFRFTADTLRFQRVPWKRVEIAWSDIESIAPRRESGYRPFISSLVLNIEMKESVALTYPYGRRPRLRIPNVLLSVSYSDIVRTISQYTLVTLIHADWYTP